MKTRVALVALLMAGGLISHQCRAQPIPQTLYLQKNLADLEVYFRHRLLRISYDVQSRKTGEPSSVRGTGFLISAGGYAVTARHVLEPAMDFENFDLLSFRIEYVDGHRIETAKLDPKSIVQSTTADITTFRVATQSGAKFDKYLCLELSNAVAIVPQTARLATMQFFRTSPSDWQLVQKVLPIEQRQGPGGLFDYWAFNEEFHESMSGGAVLLNGRVVGVVSNSLMEGKKTVRSGNYANLLRYADDTGWRGRADECPTTVENQNDFVPFASRQAFMSSTCEGTLAWQPDVAPGQYWTMPKRGNYAIRRRDLLDCDPKVCDTCASSSLRALRMVVNHSIAPRKELQCPSKSANALTAATFYGAQVVPLFDEESRDTQRLEAWLYRNRKLLRRKSNGAFGGHTAGPRKMRVSLPPSAYNEITLQRPRAPDYSAPKCSGISRSECEDLTGLDYFDFQTRRGQQWHGYTRAAPRPISTLGDRPTRETWAVPLTWASTALQVKNWILAYEPTPKPTSTKPVDFAFCVDETWDGFFVRTFSPEREIGDERIHVFLVK